MGSRDTAAAKHLTLSHNKAPIAPRRQYPGFHMQLAISGGTTTVDVGSFTLDRPDMERSDLSEFLEDSPLPTGTTIGNLPKATIKSLICPSDEPKMINQGKEGPTSYQCNGHIFQDGKGLSQAFISTHDGASMTLMLSENVRNDSIAKVSNVHNWWDGPPC